MYLEKDAEQYGFPNRIKMLEEFKKYLEKDLSPSSVMTYWYSIKAMLDTIEDLTWNNIEPVLIQMTTSKDTSFRSAWSKLVKFVDSHGIPGSLFSIKTMNALPNQIQAPAEKHSIGRDICILAEMQKEIFQYAGNVMLTTKEKKVLNKMVSIRIGEMEWVFKSPENKGKPHLMALLKIIQWGYKGHKNPAESDFLLVSSPGSSMPMTTKRVQEIITAEGLNIQKLCSGYFLDAKVCTTVDGVDLRLSSWQEEQMTRKGLLKPRFIIDLDQELPADVAELPAMIPERRGDPVAQEIAEHDIWLKKFMADAKAKYESMPKVDWKKEHDEYQAKLTPEEKKNRELEQLLDRASIKKDAVNRELWIEEKADLVARKARKELEATLPKRRPGRQTEEEKKAWADVIAALPVVVAPEKKSIQLQKELDEITARIAQLQTELAGYKAPMPEQSPEELALIQLMEKERLEAETAQLQLEEEMLAAEATPETATATEVAVSTDPSDGSQAADDQKSSIGGTYPEATGAPLESTKPEEPESFGPAALDEW